VGDLAFARVGVTAEPDLHDEALTPRHRCLLLATDGVWAFVSSQVRPPPPSQSDRRTA